MYSNKHSNDSTENEINHETFMDYKPLTATPNTIETKLKGSLKNNKNERGMFSKQYDILDVQKSSRITTTTTANSTASTDSGVNSSDNDDIPPPSNKSSHLNSFETNISANHCNRQFHKNDTYINRDNNINKNEGNNCKFAINNNKKFIINNDDENLDDKFINTNSSKEGNNTRYQHNIENVIDCKNVINFAKQGNHKTFSSIETPTAQPISNKSQQHNDKHSLQHNGFIHLQRRPLPTMSPLSMSSTTNSYDNNLPSNMHTCKGSPVISIRSIGSTIITSESDSDSDINSDADNYIIKKLGTQTTYPPNDPAIPNISNSHSVLNQKVIANSNQTPLPPLEALAVIGDKIGAAQALGPAPLISSVNQRQQIGSIALNNSNDVTFGDKHFYEGPVTIQQFLIDSRDKCKETDGKENPTFSNENSESSTNDAKDINSDADISSNIYGYILRRKRMIIPGVLAFTALLIVASIWGSKMLNESKSKLVFGSNEESRNIIPINSTIGQDNIGGGYVFRMVPRDGWLAQPPVNPWVKLKLPVDRVVIIPTRTSECETQAACTYTVRITQTYNIESQQQDDIIYNFLIGGDGNIYEGRGWDNRGSVVKGFNDDSISFAFIGSFKKKSPSYKQLNVTELLLREGIRLKKLSLNYKIVGANTLDPTSVGTAADALYKSFENWPHWSSK